MFSCRILEIVLLRTTPPWVTARGYLKTLSLTNPAYVADNICIIWRYTRLCEFKRSAIHGFHSRYLQSCGTQMVKATTAMLVHITKEVHSNSWCASTWPP